MDYQPPKDFWEVNKNLSYNTPLEVGDPLFVPIDKIRGEAGFSKLLRPLGIKLPDYKLKYSRDHSHTVFCGHHGCGKSTELRLLKSKLDNPDAYLVIFVDIPDELGNVIDLHYVSPLRKVRPDL